MTDYSHLSEEELLDKLIAVETLIELKKRRPGSANNIAAELLARGLGGMLDGLGKRQQQPGRQDDDKNIIDGEWRPLEGK